MQSYGSVYRNMGSPSVAPLSKEQLDYRIEGFKGLGFDDEEAFYLAVAVDSRGQPPKVTEVEAVIKAGCPRDLILKIFA